MNLLSLRKVITIFIVIFSFCVFFKIFAGAAELVERSNPDLGYDEIIDYETSTVNDESNSDKNLPELNDTVFTANKNATLGDLTIRVSLIVSILLVTLVLAKVFLSRDRFGKVGSILDEFAGKITGNYGSFANNQGLKLKQTLILTPGQNLYLVEIDGKRLLLGATHNGGVQFLADLTHDARVGLKDIQPDVSLQLAGNKAQNGNYKTQSTISKVENDSRNGLKHMEIFPQSSIENPFFALKVDSQNISQEVKEESLKNNLPMNGHEKCSNGDSHEVKHSLKRRANFRQLLNISNVQ